QARRPRSKSHPARTRSARERSLSRLDAAAVHARCKWAFFYSGNVIPSFFPRMTATIWSPANRAFCGRHFILRARINRDCRPQRTCQALEARLGDMVIIAPVEGFGMQRDTGIHGKSLKPFLNQLGVEFTHLVAHEFGFEHEEWPPGDIDSDARQCLIHGYIHVSVTRDAFHVAECLLH